MLLSKLVNFSIPVVLINILVNTIGLTNTFCIFLGIATLYGLHLHYKEECEDLQDFLSEEISHTQPQNIIDEIESIIGEQEFTDGNILWDVSDNLVNKVEEIVEEVVEEVSPVLQEVEDEIIEQIVDQKIENIAPEILETVDEIIEEVVPESIAPVVEEVINESAPIVEEAVEEAVEEIVENEGKEEGKWFSIGPWSN